MVFIHNPSPWIFYLGIRHGVFFLPSDDWALTSGSTPRRGAALRSFRIAIWVTWRMLPTGGLLPSREMDTYPTEREVRKIHRLKYAFFKGDMFNSLEGKCLVGEVFQTGRHGKSSRNIPD